MARRFRLGKPSKREAALRRNAAFQFYGMAQRVAVPDAPKPRQASGNADEGDVLRASLELLAVHPKILLCIRQNTGSASYEARSGKWAPVDFYRIVKSPANPGDITLVDIWGLLKDSRPFAFETKHPTWRPALSGKPGSAWDRERKQAAFLAMVRNAGGVGQFVTDARQVEEALK